MTDTADKRTNRPFVDGALANILVAEGKGLEAVAAVRRSDGLPDGPVSACIVCVFAELAQSFDRAGAADSAMKYYEAFITTYDWDHLTFDPVILAPFSRRLGELYEQQGNREKASRYYLNFVNLWKNADAELQPQVAEVRRRLSRMANTEPARQP